MFNINKSKSKKIIFFSLAIILTVASLPIFSAFEAHIVNVTATIDNPVEVLTPNGGEVLPIGECYTIEWTVDERLPRPGNIDSIDLYYSTDGGITYPDENKITTISPGINGDDINSYCFNWLVPDNPTNQAKIMVLIDYANPEIPDQVDYSDDDFDIAYTVDEKTTAALWHFNEESGSTASDETGNNNGTLKPELSPPVWTTNGRYKNALSFDGTDDYVEVPHSSSLDITNAFTIEAWVKKIWINEAIHLVGKFNPSFVGWYLAIQFSLDSGANKDWMSFRTDNNTERLAFQHGIADNEWGLITITWDGQTITAYVNGVYKNSASMTNLQSTTHDVWIGTGDYPTHKYFNGVIDEVRISNIAKDFNNECDNSGCENGGDDPPAEPVPPEEGEVVINEIMWAGSSKSDNDQWIELKNISDKNLNLKGCKVKYNSNSGNENKIADLPDDTDIILNSDNYYLMSHYTKGYSNIDIAPDFGGTSKVKNFDYEKFQIKLYCPDTESNMIEIDLVGDGINPPLFGEDESPKKSMERCDNGTWQTATIGGTDNNWDLGATEFGTPGAANSPCE